MGFSKAAWRLAVMAGIVLTLAGCGVNAIPAKNEAVKAAWAQVQTEYQRRSDLIPNLVATVAGYAAQEKSTLIAVTQARANATHVSVDASTITNPAAFAKFQAAQDQLNGVLGHLLSITENYPDLKSNQNFLALQAQLEGSENRIAIARRDYNLAVQDYNTELRTFPGVIWAKTLYSSSKLAIPFAASNAAQKAPVVSFPGAAAPATPAAKP
jgi:LemA protein